MYCPLIYKIENTANNKIYIGQTMRGKKRFEEHIDSLRANRHQNSDLQTDFNIYGLPYFTFEVIEYPSKDQLNDRELFWITYYNSDDDKLGYNKNKGGNGVTTGGKPIIGVNLETGLILEFNSAIEAAKSLGLSKKNILHCCRGYCKTTKGYAWSFL